MAAVQDSLKSLTGKPLWVEKEDPPNCITSVLCTAATLPPDTQCHTLHPILSAAAPLAPDNQP
ncbi:hypothetical protein P7K49_005369 [Saguinus oedipus]|uniref:Uncharacterized protein n=1 Tax=Saguinus oedipus TaxID=9490 RepID=A0ABQ9WA27_SAGOE|nr:hypothetical protein P7K49_005369 [Saguinus oedipus]